MKIIMHHIYDGKAKEHRYFDKNGNPIKEGMVLQNDKGVKHLVYECSDHRGNPNLGFLASNPRFLELHPEWPTEYYPLHQFDLTEWEIVEIPPKVQMSSLYGEMGGANDAN